MFLKFLYLLDLRRGNAIEWCASVTENLFPTSSVSTGNLKAAVEGVFTSWKSETLQVSTHPPLSPEPVVKHLPADYWMQSCLLSGACKHQKNPQCGQCDGSLCTPHSLAVLGRYCTSEFYTQGNRVYSVSSSLLLYFDYF